MSVTDELVDFCRGINAQLGPDDGTQDEDFGWKHRVEWRDKDFTRLLVLVIYEDPAMSYLHSYDFFENKKGWVENPNVDQLTERLRWMYRKGEHSQ